MHPYEVTAIAWIGVAIWVALIIFTNRKTHPKALFYLFFVEMWERFSYYGMRALLVLYMTASVTNGGFGYDDKKAYGIYAAYGAMVYLTPILGGLLAEWLMGYRKAIIWGALLMTVGHATMAIEDQLVFLVAMSLLILGNGFFKPNISSLIGKLYPEGDPRRDGGFTIFYMGINVGAFLTGLTCGTVGQQEGWHYGFGLAGVGMFTGLLLFLHVQKIGILEDKGLPPPGAESRRLLGFAPLPVVQVGSLLLIPAISALILNNDIVDVALGIIGAVMILFMIAHSFQYDTNQRQRMWVIVVLLLFTTFFWTFFELAGSALNLFTDRHIEKAVGVGAGSLRIGTELETSNFQSFNPLFIFLFAPVFSWMWMKLAKSGWEPTAPVKFGFGLVLLGVGFLVLQAGRPFIAEGMMPAMFMILLYLFHTLGELALSPVGLSMVTKLAPQRIVGFMMGFWFLSSSIAHQAGKHIAKLTAVDETTSPAESLELGLSVFTNLGLIAIGAGVLLFFLSPILSRWMHGIK